MASQQSPGQQKLWWSPWGWGSNETAKRSLGVISQVLDYAVAIGHCTINPAHSLKRHAPAKTTAPDTITTHRMY